MEKALPFRIVKDDARPLVRQVADGLRGAVLGGYYVPGDRLPSFDAMAKMLGVSRIVTKEAFRRVAAEGLLASRERLGTFVRDTNEKRWRGRVIFVYDADETGYFQTTLAERIRVRLNAEGYLFTRSSVDRRDDGTADFSLLDAALARSTDMAIVLYAHGDVSRRLARRGVPFAAVDRCKLPVSAVGTTTLAYGEALRGFAEWCRAEGIGEVVQLGWIRHMLDATPALADAGIKCHRRMLAPDISRGKLIGIEEAAFREFRRLAEGRRFPSDTLYFFTDDNLLRGALQAFLGTGLKVPGDIRVATVTNAGAGPYIAQTLPRIEVDPVVIGDTIADATLSFLNRGEYRSGEAGGMRWIDGAASAAPSTGD
jgi:DNA-binding transcriptional regulator YhcF (GntR family)